MQIMQIICLLHLLQFYSIFVCPQWFQMMLSHLLKANSAHYSGVIFEAAQLIDVGSSPVLIRFPRGRFTAETVKTWPLCVRRESWIVRPAGIPDCKFDYLDYLLADWLASVESRMLYELDPRKHRSEHRNYQ